MENLSVLEQMNEYIQKSKETGKILFEFEYSDIYKFVAISKIYMPECDENGHGTIRIPSFVSYVGSNTYMGLYAWEDLKEDKKLTFFIPKGCRLQLPTKESSIEPCYLAKKCYKIEVEEGHELYTSAEGVLFNKEKNVLLVYPSGKTEGEYRIPDSVIQIKEGAFLKNQHLKKVFISKNVVEMEFCEFARTTALETDSENTVYMSEDGSLFSKDGKIAYHAHSEETEGFAYEYFDEDLDDFEILGGESEEVCGIEKSKTNTELFQKMINYVNKAKILGKNLFKFEYVEEENYVWISDIGDPFGCIEGRPIVKIPPFVSGLDNFSYMGNEAIKGAILYIPKGCVIGYGNPGQEGIYRYFGEWLYKIEVKEGHELYTSQDGVLFNKDKTEILCYPAYKEEEEYVIPDSVVKLDNTMFSEQLHLRKLVISKSVIKMDNFLSWGKIEIEVDPDNICYKSVHGSLYSKDGKIAYYLYDDGSKVFKIEEGTVILKKVYLPDQVNELYLPKSLEVIDGLAEILDDPHIWWGKIIAPKRLEDILSKYGSKFEVNYYE